MAIKLEEKKKYRITKGEDVMEFIPMTIDRGEDKVYVKITVPCSHHTCLILSQVEESKDKVTEEVPM